MKNSFWFVVFFFIAVPAFCSQKAVLLFDIQQNKILYSENENLELTPASTIKVLTSLIAIEKLGKDFRFCTDVYLDNQNNLYIKGYGDPLFISGEIEAFCEQLLPIIPEKINNIVLDQTFFEPQSINFNGTRKNSNQPYDSPNNALAVNFNSVFFKKHGNTFVSAEKETPLADFLIPLIKKSGLSKGRIPVVNQNNFNLLYPGYLIKDFFEKSDVKICGEIKLYKKETVSKKKIYTYTSSFKLTDIIEKMLFYSNDFIANQLFLTCGSIDRERTDTKNSLHAFKEYLLQNKIKADLFEGSGISRKNKICALEMLKILKKFSEYHYLLKSENHNFYKTGTLSNVRNLCGYYEKNNKLYIYIIFQNDSCKDPFTIFNKLKNTYLY